MRSDGEWMTAGTSKCKKKVSIASSPLSFPIEKLSPSKEFDFHLVPEIFSSILWSKTEPPKIAMIKPGYSDWQQILSKLHWVSFQTHSVRTGTSWKEYCRLGGEAFQGTPSFPQVLLLCFFGTVATPHTSPNNVLKRQKPQGFSERFNPITVKVAAVSFS